MLFHPAKCVFLPITRSRSLLDYSCELRGHTLDSVSSIKYLGITIQQNMDWDNHNNAVNKANRTLGFLWRNLKINSSAIKERAYKAFARPVLEYASSVWDPYAQKSADNLEAVQRRAARFVLNRYYNTSSVHRMLDSLGWPSLEQRRKTLGRGGVQNLQWTSPVLHHQDQTSPPPPLPPTSAAPTVNSLASSSPEHSTETVPSGTGILSPRMQ